MNRYFGISAAVVLSSLALAACGGGDYGGDEGSDGGGSDGGGGYGSAYKSEPAESGSTGGAAVRIAADPDGALAFTKPELTAESGSGTLEFENASATGHNVEIEDASGEEVAETETITGGKTSTAVELEPGTYTFYCNIPGHREAGMQGTLTVQ